MAIQISDIKVVLSGSAVNTSPILSLGGAKSTDPSGVVVSQTTTQPTNVTGVVIDNAYSNAIGNGVLKWNFTSSTLSWFPYGTTTAVGLLITDPGVGVSATYSLGDANGYLVVTIADYANLPAADAQDSSIYVNEAMDRVFDAVTAQQSTDGLIEYRCLYIYNSSASPAYDVRIWVKQQPTGPDDIDLAVQAPAVVPSIAGTAIGPLADEIDSGGVLAAAQSGGTLTAWARPTSQATGIQLGTIAGGECVEFWQQRTVYVGTTIQDPTDTSKIGISALI